MQRTKGILRIFAAAAAFAAVFYALPWTRNAIGNPKPAAERGAMPDFQFTDLSGKNWRLAEHRGRVVLVNFWATWCPPCRMETPGIVNLANEYRSKGLDVVGISLDEGGPEAVKQFAAKYNIGYPILMPDLNSSLASSIDGLPTTFLVDQDGRVARVYNGMVAESTLRRDVDHLLSQRAALN